MTCTLDFEGRAIPAKEGEPVAIALHRAGERVLGRSVKYHRPRGATCLAGHCGNCLLRIDGNPSQLACQVPCREGMRVERQNAFPNADHDLFRAADFLFAKHLNHHELLVSVPKIQGAMAEITRRLAGLGELPDGPGEPFAAAEERVCQTLLVGLGHAGQERLRALGPSDMAVDAASVADPIAGPDPRVWLQARALGIYLENDHPVVAVRRGNQLIRVLPSRVELCTGSRAQIPLFPGCDLPGVITSEAAEILARHGLKGGEKVLELSGEQLARLQRVEGGRSVERVIFTSAAGAEQAIEADAVVIRGPRAPAFELAEQAGAALVFVPRHGFAIRRGPEGQTSVPWLLAFGSCAEEVV